MVMVATFSPFNAKFRKSVLANNATTTKLTKWKWAVGREVAKVLLGFNPVICNEICVSFLLLTVENTWKRVENSPFENTNKRKTLLDDWLNFFCRTSAAASTTSWASSGGCSSASSAPGSSSTSSSWKEFK